MNKKDDWWVKWAVLGWLLSFIGSWTAWLIGTIIFNKILALIGLVGFIIFAWVIPGAFFILLAWSMDKEMEEWRSRQ